MTSRQEIRLIEFFFTGTTAPSSVETVGVQPNTAARFFMILRKLIASRMPSYELNGEVDIDESCFVGMRKGVGV